MIRVLAGLMDVPTMLDQLHKLMVQKGLSRAGALLIFACCLSVIGPLAYFYWRFDLNSTWSWFEWAVVGGEDMVRGSINDPETVALMLILFGFGVTMFPSAVQLGLARFITIPALGILIKVALAFDLGTDWPTMWEAAQQSTWYDTTFRWELLATVARVIGTAFWTVIVSIVLQSMVIMVLAVIIYCCYVLVIGDIAPRRATQPAVAAAE